MFTYKKRHLLHVFTVIPEFPNSIQRHLNHSVDDAGRRIIPPKCALSGFTQYEAQKIPNINHLNHSEVWPFFCTFPSTGIHRTLQSYTVKTPHVTHRKKGGQMWVGGGVIGRHTDYTMLLYWEIQFFSILAVCDLGVRCWA